MTQGLVVGTVRLPQPELDLLASIAKGPWFSVQTGHAYERLTKDAFRLTELAIKASQVIAIETREVPIVHDPEEVFRIAVRATTESEFRLGPDALSLCSENEPLRHLALLPTPKKISLIWKRIEYSLGQIDEHRARFVTLPDAVVLEGLHGRVLIAQDAPNWLRMDLAEAIVKRAFDEAERVDHFP